MSTPITKIFAPFSDLTEEETELVTSLLEERTLVAGEVLQNEGDEADGLVLLVEGGLTLSSSRADELAPLSPGQHVGDTSLASLGRREVTLVASEPSRVLLFSRSAFLRLSEDAPRAATRILEAILRDLASTVRGGLDQLL
ncbi:MAG: cyclic nucleotide-binding domain-containing protein [bacterium]|nr:cyclic nucleotide-binding domain-containing protein [bacterium]